MDDAKYVNELVRRAKIVSAAAMRAKNPTDRALRYRAQAASVASGPSLGGVKGKCMWCGAQKRGREAMVGHIDGQEENSSPSNLAWTCRSCNSLTSNALKAAGKGRRTKQYNPSRIDAEVLGAVGQHLTIAPKIYAAVPFSKAKVDAALWDLYNKRKIYLSEHTMKSHGDAERARLIHAGGKVFVGASLRAASGPSSNPKPKGKKVVDGAPNKGAWFNAIETTKGRGNGDMTLAEAIKLIHETPFERRREFNKVGQQARLAFMTERKSRKNEVPF